MQCINLLVDCDSVMPGLKVLIVGSGGREHALAIGLSNSPSVESIHTCPGNAGTAMLGVNHAVPASDVNAVIELAIELSVDLVVVGPRSSISFGNFRFFEGERNTKFWPSLRGC